MDKLNELSFVLKKILAWVPWEARKDLKAITGKRQPYHHFIDTVFCYTCAPPYLSGHF